MKVLLFDMHTGGHHLEYLSRLRAELLDFESVSCVDVLVSHRTERHIDFLDEESLYYLFDDSGLLDTVYTGGTLERGITKPRDQIVERLFEYVDDTEYDIIHLVQTDDILEEVHRHGCDAEIPVVGTLNGIYFTIQTPFRTEVASVLIEHGLADIARFVPDVAARRGPWNHLNLHRCLRDGPVEEVFVPTQAGRESICKALDMDSTEIPLIPDPIDLWFEGPRTKDDARNQLGIPEEEFVLLFFGEMRADKGIHVLVDALSEYDGPKLTVVFAGKPVDVDTEQLESLRESNAVDVYLDLGFVPDERVPSYFIAADAVVVPYLPSFGEYRPSGVFQKACGAMRPIIGPDFGFFRRQIEEWSLGITFEPEDPDSLRAVITHIREENAVYDTDKMREYAESQTYENMARITEEVYRNVLSP